MQLSKSINQCKELREKWFKYGMDCIEPGLNYFTNIVINSPLKPALAIFKAARLFKPQKISRMSVIAKSLDTETIRTLKEEQLFYLAKATDLSSDQDPLEFWRRKSPNLPH